MTGKEAQLKLKPTQLRELYDALAVLKEQEQTALAELHADDPERLIGRFTHSVETVAEYPALEEPFHDDRSDAWREKGNAAIDSTTAFTARLAASDVHEVTGTPELAFHYVDREIFPLRSRVLGVEQRSRRRSLDLLLKSREGYPIVAELKIRHDTPTYYALVQALMYAVELSSESQRQRLVEYSDMQLPLAEPALSIYIIGYESPETGSFRERSFAASETIARKLMLDSRCNSVLRRIAYLKAESTPDGLTFKPLFSIGPANPLKDPRS
jgi:hypothetical protein